MKNNKAIGSNWADVRNTLYTKKEIADADVQVEILSLISETISIRKSKKISQRELEALCGILQPAIARLEHGNTKTPTVATFLKILKPLGKTLGIVDLK